MGTRFGWAPKWLTSLQALCACGALFGAPAGALGATSELAPPTATAPSIVTSDAQVFGFSFDRRVLTLLVMGCVVGMIAGWANGGPRETRLRLFKKQKTTHLAVIVPAGPAPRLIPSDSPNVTRARWNRTPVSRRTPAPAALSVRSTPG
jgi:hypothetical protein